MVPMLEGQVCRQFIGDGRQVNKSIFTRSDGALTEMAQRLFEFAFHPGFLPHQNRQLVLEIGWAVLGHLGESGHMATDALFIYAPLGCG